jgi:hypothetical protein
LADLITNNISIADKIEEVMGLVSKESWAAFGKWAFVSLATAMFFFGIACLLGRVKEVERLAGIPLILLGAWMVIALYRSPGARARRRSISKRRGR